jgi:hypothetical protein
MFLFRDLDSVLRRTGLPREIRQSLAIWSHIAGRDPGEAPSLLAVVAALIHDPGAYYPRGGMGTIGDRLYRRAVAAGVDVRLASAVRKIHFADGNRPRVEVDGEAIPFDAVVSNAGGLATYLGLVADLPARARSRLERWALQSRRRRCRSLPTCGFTFSPVPEAAGSSSGPELSAEIRGSRASSRPQNRRTKSGCSNACCARAGGSLSRARARSFSPGRRRAGAATFVSIETA